MSQNEYEYKIGSLQTCANFDEFRSLRHKLAWIGHTTSNIIALVHIMFQVIESTIKARYITLINGIVKWVKEDEGRDIRKHSLENKVWG